VLVLNSSWVPINVTTVYEAICKGLNDRARFVDPETYMTYDFESWVSTWDDAIRHAKIEVPSISTSRVFIRVPEVITTPGYGGMATGKCKGRPKFSRRNIYLRDRNQCQFCGKKLKTEELNLDHVIPKSKGGGMTWTNIVLSCIKCNDKKRNRTPEQAGMRLIRKPTVPKPGELRRSYGERLRRKLGRDIPSTWEGFLSKMFWEVGLQDD